MEASPDSLRRGLRRLSEDDTPVGLGALVSIQRVRSRAFLVRVGRGRGVARAMHGLVIVKLWSMGQRRQSSQVDGLLALLKAKDQQVAELTRQVAALTDQVQQLVVRLNKDSKTSGKPPSSDPVARRPKGGSSRTSTGRKPGGQKGSATGTLR